MAAQNGRADAVAWLLSLGADAGAVASVRAAAAAAPACLPVARPAPRRCLPVVRWLPPCQKARSPLHLACEGGHTAAVSALIRGGAALDPLSKDGLRPIDVAAARDDASTVLALVAAGAAVGPPQACVRAQTPKPAPPLSAVQPSLSCHPLLCFDLRAPAASAAEEPPSAARLAPPAGRAGDPSGAARRLRLRRATAPRR